MHYDDNIGIIKSSCYNSHRKSATYIHVVAPYYNNYEYYYSIRLSSHCYSDEYSMQAYSKLLIINCSG